MKKLLIITLLTLTVSACQTTNSGIGAAAGGIFGGLLGNTLGKGGGNTAATIGGAVLGTVLGSSVGAHMDEPHPPSKNQQKCLDLTGTMYYNGTYIIRRIN